MAKGLWRPSHSEVRWHRVLFVFAPDMPSIFFAHQGVYVAEKAMDLLPGFAVAKAHSGLGRHL